MYPNLPKWFYNINLYRITVVVTGILTILGAVLVINDPAVGVQATIRNYYTALIEMDLTRAVQYTSGQLRQNFTEFRDQIDEAVAKSGYSGSLRDITVNIVDLRENYAKASVRLLTDQHTTILSRTMAERLFDVELAFVDSSWRVVSSVQRRVSLVD